MLAVAGQVAAASLQIGRGEIVEQQGAVLQVPPRQRGLDEALLLAQPIERGVNLPGGDAAETQRLTQRMARGGGIEHPRGRQLGRRIEQSGDYQRKGQVTPACCGAPRQQRIKGDATCDVRAGEHVAVRQRHAIRTLWVAGSSRSQRNTARLFDAFGRPMRQVRRCGSWSCHSRGSPRAAGSPAARRAKFGLAQLHALDEQITSLETAIVASARRLGH
jgi:hypothetical protein